MKKYLLLCSALTVASPAQVAALSSDRTDLPSQTTKLDCATPPSCAEWGFTMSVDDCTGKFVLRCPREPNNDNAVFCGGEDTIAKCIAAGYTDTGTYCDPTKYMKEDKCPYNSLYYKCARMTNAEMCIQDGYIATCSSGYYAIENCSYDNSYVKCSEISCDHLTGGTYFPNQAKGCGKCGDTKQNGYVTTNYKANDGVSTCYTCCSLVKSGCATFTGCSGSTPVVGGGDTGTAN